MTEITCPELARELDTFYDDPYTEASGMGSEMAPLLIERHEARHGCRQQEPSGDASRNWHAGPGRSRPEPAAPRKLSADDCIRSGQHGLMLRSGTYHEHAAPEIAQSQLHREPNEGGTLFTAEASQLGLGPGIWPEEIVVQLDPHGMEPAMPESFWLRRFDRYEGDVIAAWYSTRLGQTFLQIFND